MAELRSATVTGVAQITATLVRENTSDRVSIQMVAAAPDRVVVTPDEPTVDNNGVDTVVNHPGFVGERLV